MKIVISGDHASPALKSVIKNHLEQNGYEVNDLGPFTDDSVDYPDFAHQLCEVIEADQAELGILICGSGQGVAMSANKHQSIRAALCWNEEIVQLSKEHNNANVLCFGARFINESLALKMVDTFVNVPFEGGRHERRVNKISC